MTVRTSVIRYFSFMSGGSATVDPERNPFILKDSAGGDA